MDRVLIIADLHLDAKTPLHPSYRLVKKFAKWWRPTILVELGDLIDFGFISKFDKDKLKLIEGRTFKAEYDHANKELDFWCGLRSIRRIIKRQGNHEIRVDVVIQRVPAFEGMIEVENQLRLKQRGIEYYRELDSPTTLGHMYFIHGWYAVKYHASKHWNEWGDNLIYGHIHEFQSYSKCQKSEEREYEVCSIACLTDKYPDWVKGRPTRFSHGFGVSYLQRNGQYNFYPVRIVNNQFVFEGKKFKL